MNTYQIKITIKDVDGNEVSAARIIEAHTPLTALSKYDDVCGLPDRIKSITIKPIGKQRKPPTRQRILCAVESVIV